jgi:hypothetical protein
MSDETKHANTAGHGDYEQRDIGIAPVLYFLLGLAFAGIVAMFVVTVVYNKLEKRNEEQQVAISPLVPNVPTDTRHLPSEFHGDYEKYLKQNFPAPQLEVDERTQLNDVRLKEEQILSTYGYVDQNAGTVRIPIERAMDLIAQRGLPARTQGATTMPAQTEAAAKNNQAKADQAKQAAEKKKK